MLLCNEHDKGSDPMFAGQLRLLKGENLEFTNTFSGAEKKNMR